MFLKRKTEQSTRDSWRDLPNGYQETIRRGINAVSIVFSSDSVCTKEKMRKWNQEIIIGRKIITRVNIRNPKNSEKKENNHRFATFAKMMLIKNNASNQSIPFHTLHHESTKFLSSSVRSLVVFFNEA